MVDDEGCFSAVGCTVSEGDEGCEHHMTSYLYIHPVSVLGRDRKNDTDTTCYLLHRASVSKTASWAAAFTERLYMLGTCLRGTSEDDSLMSSVTANLAVWE